MKRKGFVVLSLLIIAALMAAMGTGAIDVFTANRSSAMTVVNDSEALIALSGDGLYAKEAANGTLKLDFTESNTSFTGAGFNPQAYSAFNNVFTVTNQSPKTIYVWLEATGWSSQHNGGLRYRVNGNTGVMTSDLTANPGGAAAHNLLLWSTGDNFVNGVGRLAYVQLDPGENFTVDINANTVLGNGYGDGHNPNGYSNWSHTVSVKANTTAPARP